MSVFNNVRKLDSLVDYKSLTADTTLTVNESGKHILLDAIGEAITLPGVATSTGFKYRFICDTTTVTSDWVITAATAVIFGQVTVAGALIAADAESVITLVVAKFLPGDWVEIECDGTNWYVSGQVVTAAGCVFTAP